MQLPQLIDWFPFNVSMFMIHISLLLIAVVAATNVVTFHDGIQVPHARAATEEVHSAPADLRSDESPSAKRRRVIPDEVPPHNGILAVNPRYTSVALQRLKKRKEVLYFGLEHPEHRDVAFRYYNELTEAEEKRRRQAISRIKSGDGIPTRQLPPVQSQEDVIIPQTVRSDDTIQGGAPLERLKKRTEVLVFGLKHPEHRDVSFRYYNELRQADGLEPQSFDKFMSKRRKMGLSLKIRHAIWNLELGKPLSNSERLVLTCIKNKNSNIYASIKIRLQIRKAMVRLQKKTSPLTSEEERSLNVLSRKYTSLRQTHREFFN